MLVFKLTKILLFGTEHKYKQHIGGKLVRNIPPSISIGPIQIYTWAILLLNIAVYTVKITTYLHLFFSFKSYGMYRFSCKDLLSW